MPKEDRKKTADRNSTARERLRNQLEVTLSYEVDAFGSIIGAPVVSPGKPKKSEPGHRLTAAGNFGPDGKITAKIDPESLAIMNREGIPFPDFSPQSEVKRSQNLLKSIVNLGLTDAAKKEMQKVLQATSGAKQEINMAIRFGFRMSCNAEIQSLDMLGPIQMGAINRLHLEGHPNDIAVKDAIRSILVAVIGLKTSIGIANHELRADAAMLIDDLYNHTQGVDHPKITALIKLISYVDGRGILPSIFFNNLAEKFESFRKKIASSNLDEELEQLFPILDNNEELLALRIKLREKVKKIQQSVVDISTAYEELQRNLIIICEKTGISQEQLKQMKIDMIRKLFASLKKHEAYSSPAIKQKVKLECLLVEKAIINPDFDKDANPYEVFGEIIDSLGDDEENFIHDHKITLKTKTQSEPSFDEQMKRKIMQLQSLQIVQPRPVELSLAEACQLGGKAGLARVKELLPTRSSKLKPHPSHIQALYFACESGDLDILNHLFKEIHFGKSINSFAEGQDKNALMIAAHNGHFAIVKRLLSSTDNNDDSKKNALALAKTSEIQALIKSKIRQRIISSGSAIPSLASAESKSPVSAVSVDPKVIESTIKTIEANFEEAKKKQDELQPLFTACEELHNHLSTRGIVLFEREFNSIKAQHEKICREEKLNNQLFDRTKHKSLVLQDYLQIRTGQNRTERDRTSLSHQLESLIPKLNKLKNKKSSEEKDTTPVATLDEKKKTPGHELPKHEIKSAAAPVSHAARPTFFHGRATHTEEITYRPPAGQNTLDLYLKDAEYKNARANLIANIRTCNDDLIFDADIRELKDDGSFLRKMQIDGIRFNILEFMKKQSTITAGLEVSISAEHALLIENALTYSKGWISETTTDADTIDLFIKIRIFSTALIDAFEARRRFEFEKTKLGQEILAHGSQVEIQRAEREKKSSDQGDRSHYTLALATKRFRYRYLGYSLLLPFSKEKPQSKISECLCESALSMVDQLERTYGYKPENVAPKQAVINAHQDDMAVAGRPSATPLAISLADSKLGLWTKGPSKNLSRSKVTMSRRMSF